MLTVLRGRLARPDQPSDSDVERSEPDPDFPSNAVSLRCCSANCVSITLFARDVRQLTITESSQVGVAPDVVLPASLSSTETIADTVAL